MLRIEFTVQFSAPGAHHFHMLDYAEPVTRLIDEFKRLPGIGHKSAQRLAFHLLKTTPEDAERLGVSLAEELLDSGARDILAAVYAGEAPR